MAASFDFKKCRDPFLTERVQAAMEKAKRLLSGLVETEDDLEWHLRLIISEEYNLPLNSPYFQGLCLDELAFEAYVIIERRKKKETKPVDAISNNLDEAAKYASEGWDNVAPAEPTPEEVADMKKFMETGKFKGE